MGSTETASPKLKEIRTIFCAHCEKETLYFTHRLADYSSTAHTLWYADKEEESLEFLE